MGHLASNQVDKVRQKLVETRVGADRGKGRSAESGFLFVGVIVENRRLDLIEIQGKLFTNDVLDERSERYIVVACEGGQGGVGAGSFGKEVFGGGLGCGGVLRYGRLDAFDGEPMG